MSKISIIILLLFSFVGQLILTDSAFASITDGTIDSTYKYAYGENAGWINFGTTNGNVHVTDSGLSGYALGENIGWLYLSDITNDGQGNLSGYAWGENIGWINFNPTNGGVIINSSGEFTGSALGENIGWIIFDCDHQVKTDWRPQSARPQCNNATDDDNDGKTDYPNDPGCSSLDDNDETDPAGGALLLGAYNPTTSPSPALKNPKGEFKILINNNEEYAKKREIALKLFAGKDTKKMAISNDPDFSGPGTGQIAFQSPYVWDLCSGQKECPDGVYTVYAEFYTQHSQPSQVVSDTIILDSNPPEIKIIKSKNYYNSAEEVILIGKTEAETEVILHWDKKYGLIYADKQGKLTINLGKMLIGEYQLELMPTDLAGNKGKTLIYGLTIKSLTGISETGPEVIPKKSKKSLIEKIPEILEPLIPEFLKPEEEEKKQKEMIVIPEKTPLSMSGQWKLLPGKSIKTFVLAPLPKEIRKLAEKFPELGETLRKIGITKITDIEKLKSVKLTLPGLTERMGLSTVKIEPGKLALPDGIPTAKLSSQTKEQIPSEIVFAKTGGELIDFNIVLTIDEKGRPQQKIATISGKPLQLVVKPDKPVKSIKGYVVFKSKKRQEISFEFPSSYLAASLIFANPVLAHPQDKPVRVEEKLVLLEFEYIDPDGDGIYTAEIQTPLVEGEYEIITVMDFEDPELGKKEIRLITVVDPEGYIYTQLPGGKLRITGAIVSLHWLNLETKQYELWPAKEYQQENPQITDDTGKYSFLVPPGMYYLKVEAPKYPTYQSETFQVKEGSGIHKNIELKTKYWWLRIVDWKIVVLIVFGILLLYNFYRDKIRSTKRSPVSKIKKSC